MHVLCIFAMQQRQQLCSFSQGGRNAVQAIPKHAIIILQVEFKYNKRNKLIVWIKWYEVFPM